MELWLASLDANEAASADQRSEYSATGNEHSEAQSVNDDGISQPPLLRAESRQ